MQSIENTPTLQYSVSHSDDMVALAFTRYKAIGIDIEKEKQIQEYRQLACDFFNKHESDEICNGSIHTFYYYWTIKEAYVKALGIGLQKSMESFYVDDGAIIDKGKEVDDWEVFTIDRIKENIV